MGPGELAVHREVLFPVVRVVAPKAGGSGTIVWSRPIGQSDEYSTFILTNHHVIASAITVSKKWHPFLGRELKTETRGNVTVEIFKYKHGARWVGTNSVEAQIVAYHEEQDIALLLLESVDSAPHIARLPSREREKEIQIFDRVYAVGAALGHAPLATIGSITFMDDIIENYRYWMSTAPIIFGNSGGAVFTAKNHEFIGIPSRVSVAGGPWGMSSAVTHMGYFVPVFRIYDWLESEYYHFIFDSSVDPVLCAKERRRAQEEQRRLLDVQMAHEAGGEKAG